MKFYIGLTQRKLNDGELLTGMNWPGHALAFQPALDALDVWVYPV